MWEISFCICFGGRGRAERQHLCIVKFNDLSAEYFECSIATLYAECAELPADAGMPLLLERSRKIASV